MYANAQVDLEAQMANVPVSAQDTISAIHNETAEQDGASSAGSLGDAGMKSLDHCMYRVYIFAQPPPSPPPFPILLYKY